MNERTKVGLVLSGGGAKGAYEVGVIRALLDSGICIDAISGASIGALNGAVVACAPSLETGARRLETLWRQLAEVPPLRANVPGYIPLLLSAGLSLAGGSILDAMRRVVRTGAMTTRITLPDWLIGTEEGLLSDNSLRELMKEYLDIEALAVGVPFYVSVYRSMGGLEDVLRVLFSEIGIGNTPKSDFLHMQSLPAQQQEAALLASAAIPILFAQHEIGGSLYSDGGQGGWKTQQGNTPITPLIEAGHDLIVVTHLNDGSLWSRHEFPDTLILEVRPRSMIARDVGLMGGVKDVLGFDLRKIPSWIEQGYEDAFHCLNRIEEALSGRRNWRRSEVALAESEARNETADKVLAEAMAKLT